MSDDFDPYYTWLGIPPAEQPADHYRLLGLQRFESNTDVISNAADQRMGHVRTFQSGKRSTQSQAILNELARAAGCLLSPDRKQAYDDQLRQQVSTAPVSPPGLALQGDPMAPPPSAAAAAFPAVDVTVEASPATNVKVAVPVVGDRPRARQRSRGKRQPAFLLPIIGVGIIAIIVGTLMLWKPWATDSSDPGVPKDSAKVPIPTDDAQQNRLKKFQRDGQDAANAALQANVNLANPDGTDSPADENQDPGPATNVAQNDPPSAAREVPFHALDFDGSAAVQFVGTEAFSAEMPEFTAEAWVRFEPTNDEMAYLMGNLNVDPPAGGWGLAARSDGRTIQLTLALRGTTRSSGAAGRTIPFDRQWHHVAVVKSRDNYLRIFLDGRLSGGLMWDHGNDPAGDPLHLGSLPGYSPGFRGSIRAFRFSTNRRYSGVFPLPSDHQFQADAETAILADFARPTADQIADTSGNQHHGLLTATRWIRVEGDRQLVINATRSMNAIPPNTGPTNTADNPPPTVDLTSGGQMPVPDAGQQEAALSELRSLMPELQTASTADERIALAKKLMTEAGSPREEAALRFVMWQQAASQAAAALDLAMAYTVVEELDAVFDIDPWTEKVAALTRAGEAARSNDQRKLIVVAAANLSEQCRADEQYEASFLAADVASNASAGNQRKTARKRRDLAEHRWTHWQQAEPARQVLQDSPDDLDANLVWGKFLCLVEQDWDQGLPLLVKAGAGKDALWHQAAILEQQRPAAPADQFQLAELWSKIADEARGFDELPLQARARFWYARCEARLPRREQSVAQRRITEIDRWIASQTLADDSPGRPAPGLDGIVSLDGRPVVAPMLYLPGQQLSHDQVVAHLRSLGLRFDQTVEIHFEGLVDVPVQTVVQFAQTCSSDNGGTAQLLVDDTLYGIVGAGQVPQQTGSLTLSAGSHRVSWRLRGQDLGTCGMAFKLSSGANLPIYHLPVDRWPTGN